MFEGGFPGLSWPPALPSPSPSPAGETESVYAGLLAKDVALDSLDFDEASPFGGTGASEHWKAPWTANPSGTFFCMLLYVSISLKVPPPQL